MDNLINVVTQVNTSDYTLIVPSVAVGNVGQLTIDLLISTYNFKRYATVWDPAIIPSVGGDPFNCNSIDISTACELFINEEMQLVLMQLRSGIENKLAVKFFNKFRESLIKLKFKHILILTSAFAHELHNINSSHFRYISNNDTLHEKFNTLNVLEETAEGYVIFGGGFATKLYEVLKDSFMCTLIMKYTSEGDNQPDAIQMLEVVTKALKNFESKHKEIVVPTSWQYAFGNPPPIGIY